MSSTLFRTQTPRIGLRFSLAWRRGSERGRVLAPETVTSEVPLAPLISPGSPACPGISSNGPHAIKPNKIEPFKEMCFFSPSISNCSRGISRNKAAQKRLMPSLFRRKPLFSKERLFWIPIGFCAWRKSLLSQTCRLKNNNTTFYCLL